MDLILEVFYSLNDFTILFLFCNTEELHFRMGLFMAFGICVGKEIPELFISKALSVGGLWIDDTGQIPATSGCFLI